MHREYHPDDMRHHQAHAFGGDHDHEPRRLEHRHDDHRPLYVFTAVLGVLIAADVVLGGLGGESWRAPLGVSWAWIAAVLGGARIVYGALEALFQSRIGADFALAQACVAAIVLGEPFVAAEVVFIALVGEALEAITADRAFRAIGRLFDQAPKVARVRRDGQEIEMPADQVVVGDLVIVGAGERVPVDGRVVAGRSTIDPSSLTGESIPVDAGPGDTVAAGTINQFGRLEVHAEKVGHATTLGQVLRLVAQAQQRKAPLQRTADRLAGYFLPVVETVAVVTVIVGVWLGWPDVWSRAVAVLVVACPCALVLATPAAILASLAWLARHGVVAKGGAAIERLARCDTFAFDKTGTLTLGRPELASVRPLADLGETELLRLAAGAESASRHPLAEVLRRAVAQRGLSAAEADDVEALPGAGVSARCRLDGGEAVSVLVGNRRLLAERGLTLDDATDAALAELDALGETLLLVAVENRVVGLIGARDPVRPEAHDIIHDLKHLNIQELAILTGDRPGSAKYVAKKVHIKNVETELLPADKARWIHDRQHAGRKVAMVGDGINDAPALAQAHVGIALGGVGADLAAEAGDLVLMGDPLRVLPDLVKLSRKTVAIIQQNIVGFAFLLNAVAMGSAALGWLGPVPAAILHQAGSLLVLLNSMRLLAFGDWHNLGPVRRARELGEAVARLDDRLDLAAVIESVGRRRRRLGALGLALAASTYATWNLVAIRPGEVGLARRMGRFVATLGPGPHWRWPPPFESVDRLEPGRVRGIDIGFRVVASGPVGWEASHERSAIVRGEDEALMMTGDGQLVELAATAQYRVDRDRLRAYAFDVADADEALRSLAESAIRAVVSRRTLDDLLTSGRRTAEGAAAEDLQRRVDAYGLGLIVERIDFQDVHPPLPVVEAYRDVSKADGEKRTRIQQAETYRVEALTEARGQALATRERAEGARLASVARARGEAAGFLARERARRVAPALVDFRLYEEALSAALAQKTKVVLDPAQAGRRRHLILPSVADVMGTRPQPTTEPPDPPRRP
jgi:Cu+-exporting ATPase